MKRRISLKRTIITLAFALLTTIVYAAKANPMPATIVQPDGKLLTIVLHGDEHAHYVATTDGVLLYREGNSYFVAKTDDDGELCPTPFLAHNAGQLLACGRRTHSHRQSTARTFPSVATAKSHAQGRDAYPLCEQLFSA